MTRARTARFIRPIIALIGVLVLLGLVNSTVYARKPPAVAVPDLSSDRPQQTGESTVVFDQRHPLSKISRMKARTRYATAEPAPEYDLGDESYQVWMPASYDVQKSYGLLVWVSPMNSGSPPAAWLPILEKHGLLWVGPNDAGNKRIGWYRFGLALDAVTNMKKRFSVDSDRVYIAGMSGGGRIASRLGVAFADVFSGAFPIVGCDFYKKTPVSGRSGFFYQERYKAPPGKILGKAMRENRYVLLTGTDDFNRDETQTIYEQGFMKEKFTHVTYLEVPGMGHALPDADWFEQGIVALDEPLAEIRASVAQKAREMEEKASKALEKALKTFENDPVAGYVELVALAEAFDGAPSAATARAKAEEFAADPANQVQLEQVKFRDEAVQLLLVAESYVKAGRPDLARVKLDKVIQIVPGTDLARTAAERLAALGRR